MCGRSRRGHFHLTTDTGVRASLPQFFTGGAAELEIVAADGELMRIDRLVETDDTIWVIDFKWRVTEAERVRYEAQLRRYAEVLRNIRADKPLKLGLVGSDGNLIEVQVGG